MLSRFGPLLSCACPLKQESLTEAKLLVFINIIDIVSFKDFDAVLQSYSDDHDISLEQVINQ